MRNKSSWSFAIGVVLSALLSPLAASPAIQRGVDTFTTPADGSTYYDFAQQPIPAGFFCATSEPFTGRVTLRGLPLAAAGARQLNGVDTVIERLNDAVFDSHGRASTRIRFKALSLVSLAPIETKCGAFHVYVSLAGKQRQTVMRIRRTSEKGGVFSAPLAVDARMSFIPVERAREGKASPLTLVGSFTFPETALPWRYAPHPRDGRSVSLAVDTNGDQVPDTVIFSTPSFEPAGSTQSFLAKLPAGCVSCPGQEACHADPATHKEHCTILNVCAPDTCESHLPGEN